MNLVTGGSGQLGTAFRSLWPDAFYPSHDALDLAQADGVYGQLEHWQPKLIINCAAYTDVDGAEQDEEIATEINGRSVGEMARYADEHGIPFVHFSTDYVFDGKAQRPYVESDATAPIGAYGRSKRLGEIEALLCSTALVIRTSWVISGTHPNFVATILRLVPDRRLSVVDDQHGCPTIAADLAAGAIRCLEAGLTGIVHLSSPPETTWFRLAREVVRLSGLDPDRVKPCTTEEYPSPATRPQYSVLGSERLEVAGIAGLPSWKAGLPELVAEQLRRRR